MRIFIACLCLSLFAAAALAANPLWVGPGWYMLSFNNDKHDGTTPIQSGPYPDEAACNLDRPATGDLTSCRYFAADPDAH